MGSDAITLNFLKELDSTDCNNFFLKSRRILTKINISCLKSYRQSARPTHPIASIWHKLWEGSIWHKWR